MPLSDIYQRTALVNGVPQTVRFTAADKMHVVLSPLGDIAWRDAITDVAYLNGQPLMDGRKVFGNFPLAFDAADGWLFAQFVTAEDERKPEGVVRLFHPDGFLMPETLPGVSPEGIKSVVNSVVTFWDFNSDLRVMPNGETWASVVDTESFIVGGVGNAQFNNAIGVWDKRSNTLTGRWLGYTPNVVFALEHDGRLYLDITGVPDAPMPDAVPLAKDWPPLPVPVPPPIPLLGLVPPTEPFAACFTGTNQDGGFVAAGNACWSAGPETE